MYGTKARIGVLVPSANTTTEAEFNALVPEGMTIHSARMFILYPTVETLARMNEDIEMASELIATMKPNAVVFACTTGSLLEGVGYDTQLIQRIQKVVKVPTTTTATAVIQAFHELGIRSVSVGTPYNEELTRREKEFFEKSGIHVPKIKGLNFQDKDWFEDHLDRVKNLAHEVNQANADAVFLSCTNLKAVPVIPDLERELGKYVFSSNVATFWQAMRLIGWKENIKGRGKLLERIK